MDRGQPYPLPVVPLPDVTIVRSRIQNARGTAGRVLGWLGLLVGLLVRAATSNVATNGEFIVQSWGTSEGAPSGPIVALCQTTDGFLWSVSNAGAVHLYSPTGVLISTLTGSSAGDHVGNAGITVLSTPATMRYTAPARTMAPSPTPAP